MELFPTPLKQTPQGNLLVFCLSLGPCRECMTLVFRVLTQSPFDSIPCVHLDSFRSRSSLDSATIMRSSEYKSSHGQPVQSSLERASITMINSNGAKKNSVVSGNAGDEKKTHPVARKIFFLHFLDFGGGERN